MFAYNINVCNVAERKISTETKRKNGNKQASEQEEENNQTRVFSASPNEWWHKRSV